MIEGGGGDGERGTPHVARINPRGLGVYFTMTESNCPRWQRKGQATGESSTSIRTIRTSESGYISEKG